MVSADRVPRALPKSRYVFQHDYLEVLRKLFFIIHRSPPFVEINITGKVIIIKYEMVVNTSKVVHLV